MTSCSMLVTAQAKLHQKRLALLHVSRIPDAKPKLMTAPRQEGGSWEALLGLSADEAYQRRRNWNRDPLTDLFPRIPSQDLERILDICISKNFTYNFSKAPTWNARRFTAITVAHVRHQHSSYDSLLKAGVERFESRRQSGPKVWKVLREWCPWDSSNEVLEKCFQATLLPFEQREAEWAFVDDPMDIDSDSDMGRDAGGSTSHGSHVPDTPNAVDFADDPMEID